MSYSTSTVIVVGSGSADESVTLVSVANNATNTGASIDMLGDDTSTGDVELYLILTSTVAVGTLDIRVNGQRRLNGGAADYAKVNFERSVIPSNGTQKVPLGVYRCPRYLSVDAKNNGTGASLSFAVLGKVTKAS
jgi:hypothetical protein